MELWKSNGTAAGTVLVADLWPGALSSAPSFLTFVNGDLFFAASDGVLGSELWKIPDVPSATVERLSPASLRVFPNPAADAVTIQLPPDYAGEVALFDALGRQVRSTIVEHQKQVQLNLTGLEKGLYIVRLAPPFSVQGAKLIIQK
ncbi:MAG: T9SS type A sorting domain-containing protein [Saprospirales bacterium]|nr:T9SS type A sorting domain-containing protein [Saprospirales bacterium]